jgi:hypothetical protein
MKAPNTRLTRRSFLGHTAILAGSLALTRPGLAQTASKPRARVLSANDRIRVGIIGVGGRARWILKNEAMPGADVVAVSDCFLSRMDEAASQVAGGDRWKKYPRYQDMLEKEKLDAVFVETTTHARVLIAMIHAMQAGCDAYGEKPHLLTIAEGRVLVNAVRRSRARLPNRIPATVHAHQHAYASQLVRRRHRQGPHRDHLQLPRPENLEPQGRTRTDARRPRLGSVVQPNRTPPLLPRTPVRLGRLR